MGVMDICVMVACEKKLIGRGKCSWCKMNK